MLKIFLDRNVEADADIFEQNLLGEKKYILSPHKEENIKNLSILLLRHNVSFFNSDELFLEGEVVSTFPSKLRTNLFDGIEIQTLETPFDRSRFGLSSQQALRMGEYKDDVINWCKMLVNIDQARVDRYLTNQTAIKLNAFEQKCFKNISTFKALCKNVHRSHYPDIYHFWTAIEHEMDVFLTHEKKFRNEVSKNLSDLDIKCKIMNSSELLEAIETQPR